MKLHKGFRMATISGVALTGEEKGEKKENGIGRYGSEGRPE
jgi:hypothetical protein